MQRSRVSIPQRAVSTQWLNAEDKRKLLGFDPFPTQPYSYQTPSESNAAHLRKFIEEEGIGRLQVSVNETEDYSELVFSSLPVPCSPAYNAIAERCAEAAAESKQAYVLEVYRQRVYKEPFGTAAKLDLLEKWVDCEYPLEGTPTMNEAWRGFWQTWIGRWVDGWWRFNRWLAKEFETADAVRRAR